MLITSAYSSYISSVLKYLVEQFNRNVSNIAYAQIVVCPDKQFNYMWYQAIVLRTILRALWLRGRIASKCKSSLRGAGKTEL